MSRTYSRSRNVQSQVPKARDVKEAHQTARRGKEAPHKNVRGKDEGRLPTNSPSQKTLNPKRGKGRGAKRTRTFEQQENNARVMRYSYP